MADNTELSAGSGGDVIASDDIGGIKHQRVKLSVGADGTATDAVPISAGLDTTGAAVQAVGLVAQVDDTTPSSVTENQFGPVRMSTRRALLVEGVASGTVVPVSDGGGALTVDGTVAVSGTVTVDGSAVTQPVSAASLPLPSGAATSANQTTIIGHVDGIETVLGTIDADTGALAAAVSGTEMQVDVVAALPAGTNNIGDVDVASIAAGDNNIGNVDIVTVPAPLSTTGGGTEATALRVTLASDSTGVVSIDDNGGAITVDGTVAVSGTVTVDLGANNDVTVTSGAITATLAAGTNTNEVVGDAAHDAAVAGNPVLIAGAAQNCDDTAPPNRVSAESDATRLATDLDGSLFVRPHGPQVWSYHVDGSSALTDTTVHASPGAGLSLYVTDIVFSSGAATAINAFFEEGASKVLGPYYLEAVAGRGMHIRFGTPKKITAATALTVTTSAAIAHSIDVTGFVAQG